MRRWFWWLWLFMLIVPSSSGWGQSLDRILIPQMENYESDIQSTYREYQKIYYERKSSLAELRAFEDIISIYVAQILEIYETLSLSGLGQLETPRDIASRALIYRALIYLEKAPLNLEYYEKACYDYYRALAMFDNVDTIPAIFKKLPAPILVGAREYNRLIDVIDHKGSDLYAFGKVNLNLRNFKITTNLDIDEMEFARVESPVDKMRYTYNSAENLIKNTFKQVLMNDGRSSTFLALPEGSYFIKPKSKGKSSRFIFLSALYIRANQQYDYIVEPLVDWFIMYEKPITKKPRFAKSRTDNASSIEGNGKDSKHVQKSNRSNKNDEMEKLIILSEVVNSCLEKVDSDLIFNIKDPWIRNKFANTVAEVVYEHVQTLNYHNCWSKWMLSWIIAKEITEKFSPETEVPTELIRLVYYCLKNI
jgi:hypothetical protein